MKYLLRVSIWYHPSTFTVSRGACEGVLIWWPQLDFFSRINGRPGLDQFPPSWTLSSSLNYKFCICSYKSSLSHHKEDLPQFGCLLSYTVSNYKSQQIKILFATTNAHKRTTNGGTTKSIENLLQKETKQHKGEFIFILYRNRTTICQNWTTNGYKLSGVIHSTMQSKEITTKGNKISLPFAYTSICEMS